MSEDADRIEKADPVLRVWWVYLLACRDGRTYAGVAVDVQARYRMHEAGKGAKFTRANPPVALLGAQAFTTQSEALKAEFALKQLDRGAKLAWARGNPFNQDDLPIR